MTEPLRFAEPPTKNRRRQVFDWDSIYATLRDHPGQWAILAEPGYVSTYNAVTQGKVSRFRPDMGVEMRTSDNDLSAKPRTCTVWARYNPDMDQAITVKERKQAWIKSRQIDREKVSTVEREEGD